MEKVFKFLQSLICRWTIIQKINKLYILQLIELFLNIDHEKITLNKSFNQSPCCNAHLKIRTDSKKLFKLHQTFIFFDSYKSEQITEGPENIY
jgi:hypothetical protein